VKHLGCRAGLFFDFLGQIAALQFVPGRRLPPLGLVPANKFPEHGQIIALGVNRRTAMRREVREELLNPPVVRR